MTMGVDCNGFRSVVKTRSVRFAIEQIVDEFLEEKTAFRDRFGICNF